METDKHTEITPEQKEPLNLFRHLCRHKKLTVLALWILGALVITFLIRHESIRIYDYQSFRSEYARQAEEKKVTENAAIHGIYLFGPYISLPRGHYESS